MGGRSVFISYRRQLSWSLARLVRNDLVQHGFDTFMDVENLDSGEFVRKILSQIETREHFIVLLQPGSLDQICEDGDWLHREIAHALARGRNVVPVTANGFKFRRDLVLPPDVAELPSLNEVEIHQDYFPAGMEKLRTRFLLPKLAAPPPPDTRGGVEMGLPAPQLTWQYGTPLEIQLTWSEVSGADEYMLERAKAARRGDPEYFLEVYRGPNRSYNDVPVKSTGVALWRYRIRASASGQAGRWNYTGEVHTGYGM